MKHGLFYVLGIIVLSIVSITTSAAQVLVQPSTIGVPSAPGPYYATPSWDQKLPAASRFIILSDWGNAAVLDKETGLVWERSPSNTAQTLHNALSYCTTLYLGNRMGWRLPSIYEFGTLVDRSVASGPKLPSGHPFMNMQPSSYWSASYILGVWNHQGPNLIWIADFSQGYLRYIDPTPGPSHYFWCVRGGQGVGSSF